MDPKNYKKLKPAQKIMILILSFLTFYALLAFFIFLPVINNIKDLKNLIIEEKTETKKMLEQQSGLISLEKQIAKIKPDMAKLDRMFISQNRELEFITALEETARKNKVEQKIDLQAKVGDESPLSLSVSGDFFDVMDYLTALESLDYYISIKNLNLSAGRDRSGRNIDLAVQAITYWQ